jgi:2-phospho-L-lactate guanylyltransferase
VTHTVALVPIRSRTGGKTRLAGTFDPAQRARLVVRMAQLLLVAIEESGIADEIVVLTGDDDLAQVLDAPYAAFPAGVPAGLNAAIDHGRQQALSRGADRLLIAFPDLPQVTAGDLRVIDRSGSAVTIVPDRRAEGTNALLLQGRSVITDFGFRYGPGSLALHQVIAHQLNASMTMLSLPGMATDLDTMADWNELTLAARQDLCDVIGQDRAPDAHSLLLEHS